MELKLTRETLRFERFVGRGEEQVTIEGEATLPGSMRDAVTVLNVQAQAHLTGVQAVTGEASVRGRVNFQVLYTQGDLTRVRSMETSCDFMHTLPLAGLTPGMRLVPCAYVQETQGLAGSGRMTLRALLLIVLEAFETEKKDLVTGAQDGETGNLLTRRQTAVSCMRENAGENQALVREEFDLPAKLGVGDVLSASAAAGACELSGGNGRVGVSGTIEVRVLHRPQKTGNALVTTVHEMPFEVSIDTQTDESAQLQAQAEVTDVMADSIESDRSRTLRLEVEVRVSLTRSTQAKIDLLSDLYSLTGPVLEPVTETIELHTCERHMEARESTRVQVALPPDAPPIGEMLAAFSIPTLTAAAPSGRRLDAEGIMQVTLIYLPVDSDIPYAVHTREPFAMTFPVEAQEGVYAQAYAIETMLGPTTSDRAELRCVLGLHAVQHGSQQLQTVTDVTQTPETRQEHGFVLVWPAAGESRWETARKLRVPQESLKPAGRNALLAFRR
ncbi:MAG: DUF3794 domain-containing protein [Clostridia bacterium]|nr:DUF3794 domain-containing protein [Clostridia bacterium]